MIYFLRAPGHAPVKIGCSDDPFRRLLHYNLTAPYPLEIAATLPGDRKIESRFH